mmetsp:Transcript_9422/g.25548  ORF Transcript_9422/g.25548 Transcript_9422/m.25548 type:complete len:286 (+) Transcript_9422:244-1101(+)
MRAGMYEMMFRKAPNTFPNPAASRAHCLQNLWPQERPTGRYINSRQMGHVKSPSSYVADAPAMEDSLLLPDGCVFDFCRLTRRLASSPPSSPSAALSEDRTSDTTAEPLLGENPSVSGSTPRLYVSFPRLFFCDLSLSPRLLFPSVQSALGPSTNVPPSAGSGQFGVSVSSPLWSGVSSSQSISDESKRHVVACSMASSASRLLASMLWVYAVVQSSVTLAGFSSTTDSGLDCRSTLERAIFFRPSHRFRARWFSSRISPSSSASPPSSSLSTALSHCSSQIPKS